MQTATKLKKYLRGSSDTEIGNLKGELFIDFISEDIGFLLLHKGLADSIALN
ncbi:MAG: DUF2164 family protein [Endomicrobium sp.]|nr:DUF2164 family protein [Endomicrobium sp.]